MAALSLLGWVSCTVFLVRMVFPLYGGGGLLDVGSDVDIGGREIFGNQLRQRRTCYPDRHLVIIGVTKRTVLRTTVGEADHVMRFW